MKTLFNLVAETSLAVFELPKEKYNFPNDGEALRDLCEEILFDGIAKIMDAEPFDFTRKGNEMKLTGVDVAEVWRVANKLNQDLRKKVLAIDPAKDFPDVHAIKFDVEENFNPDFTYTIILTA